MRGTSGGRRVGGICQQKGAYVCGSALITVNCLCFLGDGEEDDSCDEMIEAGGRHAAITI